jgi:hypothetical protein
LKYKYNTKIQNANQIVIQNENKIIKKYYKMTISIAVCEKLLRMPWFKIARMLE